MVKVYDIETLKSCWTYTDIDKDTKEVNQFVLHKDKFELIPLVSYLKTVTHQVGFNNINFDYPIIHYILENYNFWVDAKYDANEIIDDIYKKAQEIIDKQDNFISFYDIVSIKEQDWKIKQLDLFKLWHYNNAARRTSLKALEISMNFHNVMESKVPHTKEDITLEEINDILEYNLNDVLATLAFYEKSINKIQLRQTLNKTYDLHCLNFSDSKIGERLILKLYCEKTDKYIWDVNKLRTHRNKIDLKDCILDYIAFKDDKFNKLLNKLKNLTITDTKGDFKESIVHKRMKYDFGSGGIHGICGSGIYESDDKYIIKTADVASLYPNLAITNNFYIEHLGIEFIEVYKLIIQMRLAAKAEGNTTLADGFKLSANSVYGKSNDINSFLFDPLFTMRITFNGQLLLAMLAEELADIEDSQVIMINTDGIEIKIPRNKKEEYYDICKRWEEKTKLVLEYDDYQKMIIRDVNNYCAINTNDKKKYKGAFEIDKVVGSEPAYHKDNSFKIIPIALSEYFFNNIPIATTIKNHTNIYDFCGRQKFNQGDYGQIHYLKDNKQVVEKQQRNTRYYISTNGNTFIKYYKKGTSEMINKGFLVTIFNKFEDKDNYNINYSFYIKECQKIIDIIQPLQIKFI